MTSGDGPGQPPPPGRDDPRRPFLARSGWLDHEWYVEHAVVPVPDGADLVNHFLSYGAPAGLAPNAEIDDLQNPGKVDVTESSSRPATLPDDGDPQLELEIALVAASGLFDRDFYADQVRASTKTRVKRADLVRHFCRRGWRDALRPSSTFDVWWYWTNHLNPQREAINPFVHYLLLGRAAGLSAMPDRAAERPPVPLPRDRKVRRVCLFAGFDRDGLLDEYVVDYVRELSRFADVFYLCDGHLENGELDKLQGVAAGAWAIRHGAYDFGSYSMLAQQLVGWETIEAYDELLLVNDSCYLLRDLAEVFARMDARDCDWWGLQATKGLSATSQTEVNSFDAPIPLDVVRADLLEVFERDDIYDFHIGSYFLAYRRAVLDDHNFRRLLGSVHRQRSKLAIILKYEVGLTRYLLGNGYRFETFIDALYPFHPLFTASYFELLDQGFPLLKKFLLYRNHYDVPDLRDWKERVLAVVPDARVDVFERNLLRTSPQDELARSFSIHTGDDGETIVPELLDGPAFRQADLAAPTFQHWWAFPVSMRTHRLPDNSRAIFEVVRDDPSVKKIVLTRSRAVQLSGANVVVVPLASPEGQYHLLRAGQVFVEQRPMVTVKAPLSYERRNLILVREGLAIQRGGPAARLTPTPTRNRPRPIARALLTTSNLDQLAMLTMHHHANYELCWRTGLPALDFVLKDLSELPDDLRDEESRLRGKLDGRRLVLFAPAAGRSADRLAYRFSQHELDRLAAWASRNDVVLGLRESPGDTQHAYLRQLGPIAMDLSVLRYPHVPVLLRVADALLTDFAGSGLEFMATGRPVVSFVHDLDEVADTLFYDLDHVMPGPVHRDFDGLVAALETLFDEPGPEARNRYLRTRGLFIDHLDGNSAMRTVQQVRRTQLEGTP